jgi:uncharacterized membrane protein YtjA (UPF0391 family)
MTVSRAPGSRFGIGTGPVRIATLAENIGPLRLRLFGSGPNHRLSPIRLFECGFVFVFGCWEPGAGFEVVEKQIGERAVTLLKWALLFFVVSIVAGILGFTGVSAASADIARVLFYIFVVIFVVLLLLGLTIFRA